jgi:hypothetical protein
LTASAAIDRRMVNQGLWRPAAPDGDSVLRALVGMQAQEFGYALWSVAQRLREPVGSADLLTAYNAGRLLRTHVLRTTWHFALPEDVRWLLRLTSPKLRSINAYYDRQLGLERSELDRGQGVLADEVAGGRHRTRKELAAALESAGIRANGQRLAHLVMHAEFDEVLISGAMSGKQQTYAAFDERVPAASSLRKAGVHEAAFDEFGALAELARRFVATRGPVTAKDLAVWASLTQGQAKRGLAAIEAECLTTELDGMTVFSPPSPPSQRNNDAASSDGCGPVVDLVQGYDEIVMSYSESRVLLTGGLGSLPVPDRSSHLHTILCDGRLAGHWRHRLGRDGAVIEAQLRRPLTGDERAALENAVARYGRFLGVPTSLDEPVLLT